MSDDTLKNEEIEETNSQDVIPESEEGTSNDEAQSQEDSPSTTADENSEEGSASQIDATADQGKWYVLHSQTGHENRVKNNLEQRIQSLGVEDKIFDIVIPMREIVVIKKGKKSKQKEKVFPGYIFIRMELDDESWLVVRTTEGVTGFIGAGLKPTPISDKEVNAIMKFVKQEQPKHKTHFSVGEAVKITEGPFADFLGTVDSINEEKGKLTVLVSIFDRETPVDLDFLQVKKL